jgi:hypothetical protein
LEYTAINFTEFPGADVPSKLITAITTVSKYRISVGHKEELHSIPTGKENHIKLELA